MRQTTITIVATISVPDNRPLDDYVRRIANNVHVCITPLKDISLDWNVGSSKLTVDMKVQHTNRTVLVFDDDAVDVSDL